MIWGLGNFRCGVLGLRTFSQAIKATTTNSNSGNNYSAAITAASDFRQILYHLPQLNKQSANNTTTTTTSSPSAFLLKPADYKSALQLSHPQHDPTLLQPLLHHLTSLPLQSRPSLNQFNCHQARTFLARTQNDTGSPEVQCGQLTVRMMYLGEHCGQHKHDYTSRRKLVELVARRRTLLRYLRQVSLERFYKLLDQLSLPSNYLEAFENPYNFKYRTGKKDQKKSKSK